MVDRLRAFTHHGVHVLGSFIIGLPSDRESTFNATVAVAEQSGVPFAQFVMRTPPPGTDRLRRLGKTMEGDTTRIAGAAHPPVIAVSSLASSTDHVLTEAVGFSGHIDKPFEDRRLLAAVAAAMARRFTT